ncbi:MAG TPA: TonB-dependent receptor [Chitinophagaceae bacterium]|nr:TonB-dependent receptor [Chitinophagaceae bacterium]
MRQPAIMYCFLLLFAIGGVSAQGKKEIAVSGEFNNILLSDLFQQLETLCSCSFYYEQSQVDSLRTSLVVQRAPLHEALEKALKNTGLFFSIDARNNIYITKGIAINTTLPTGFFEKKKDAAPPVASNDSLVDYEAARKKATRIVSESKLYEIGAKTNESKGNAIITGYLRNVRTGEPLINASVFESSQFSTVTDGYGYYSLTLPAGKHVLNIVALGMRDTHLQLAVYGSGKMDMDIAEQVTTLKEVIVSSKKTLNISRVQMGVERLSIENIKNIPSVFGEADVLRVVTSLPGVKTVGEASTGFNVRGGSTDQNLILFNDATIYNPSHFFGMFSAFNPDVIKDIELYKSSVPARFGGRLASVLDISSREGNKKTITGSAGIGVITSRVELEGPIVKDKTSFILGGRTTYANWLLGLLPKEYKNSKASFQDVSLGISHRIDSTSNIYFSGYFSTDRFSLNSDTSYGYTNGNFNVKWKKSFTNRLTASFIAGFDQYKYKVFSESNEVNAFTLKFDIQQLFAKADFIYYLSQKHGFDFGLSTLRYRLTPGSYEPLGAKSIVVPDFVEREQALESAGYFTYRYNPNNQLSISTGIRYSLYNYLGPKEVSYYAPGLPVESSNVTAVKTFGKGKSIQNYSGPEFRFSIRYAISNDFSIKAGYNSQRQYIHMLSNTTSIAPTDIWKLSDPNIKPQQGDQLSLGLYKNFKSNTIETSVEVYYKHIRDYLDYKPGATLLLNHNIETDVVNTKGKAYGLEFLIKKPGGKLNGWISYTYSRILLRTNGDDPNLLVNQGSFYPASYDKPNDVTLTGNFRVNHRFSISVNSTYSTGRPITVPVGRYYYAGSQRVLYSERNSYRIPDYYRTDFSLNIDGNHKVHQKTHNSWTIGVYNLLGRKNPYSVYFISENGLVNGYKLSIFGSAIPFINFNIRF